VRKCIGSDRSASAYMGEAGMRSSAPSLGRYVLKSELMLYSLWSAPMPGFSTRPRTTLSPHESARNRRTTYYEREFRRS